MKKIRTRYVLLMVFTMVLGLTACNYLRPELIGDLVKKVDGTIVECNTAYYRMNTNTAIVYAAPSGVLKKTLSWFIL